MDDLVSRLRKEIRVGIDLSTEINDRDLREKIRSKVLGDQEARRLSISEQKEIIDRIYDSMRGLDILEPLLRDPTITEIMINSKDEIFIERKGSTQQIELKFEDEERLLNVIQSIVATVNRRVNESSPIVDARLKDGSRVNVVLPPIALKGPTMTIRKFPAKPVTIEDLIEWGAISQEAADFIQSLVTARYNIFISGGTGSGKTTFLNALSNFIPEDERVITIEDSAELQIKKVKNLVAMETRNSASGSEAKEISIRDLIKSSLRMRPDRIVVGEVRGAEALDMLQAMNTGHDGSLSTGHANSPQDMLSRLETMVLSGGAGLPIEVVRKQISSAIEIMVHLSRLRDKTRKVMEICEVTGYSNGEVRLKTLYSFEEEGSRKKVEGRLEKVAELKNTSKLKTYGIQLS
ncbi:pilus assembly protein [Desulfosporosinus sp. HMP52]|uniref:CpaF family protein n=1 Tax=Desulfosporosinus sp. HMP52 TaxID=1487923 RepID=UPI00051FA999|nr:CpaF family protein [Desulfosporosinus sp. HMP52]KGK91401.1 pilus assembly protein [Desulfosporosinus sp. HMP52]